MDGDSNRTAGLESADAGSSADHPERDGGSAIARAQGAIKEAQCKLQYLNRQEVQEACELLSEAWLHLEEAPR